VQKKVIKENHTLHHGLRLPCATRHKGSKRKLASLKQPLAETTFMSALLSVLQRGKFMRHPVILSETKNL
jgi:hypothetical protein